MVVLQKAKLHNGSLEGQMPDFVLGLDFPLVTHWKYLFEDNSGYWSQI